MASTSVFDRLDPDQKEAVALRKNGAVSAGAGSGKTTVLAARYLDLVFRDGADVSSILCLTFTRKAQAEMQARVYRELCASSEPRARAQVERFAEASISTLDSFSSAVLRSSAQDYGFAPNFRVDDQACRDLAVSEALRFLLARREEAPLAELFARMGFETAWKGLFAEAAYRFATPANRSEGDFASMPARAEKAIVAALGRAKGELGAAVDQVETALETGEATTAKGKEAVALLRALPASLISGPSELTSIKNVGEPDLTVLAADCAGLAALDLRAFGRSETEKAIKEAATAAREAARRIADLARAAALLPLEREILGRLAAFAEEYREAKRRSGVMGFHDVAVCAIDLLARRKELRAYWKSRFRFIMVDEFQDDNEIQKELLYLLAEDGQFSSEGIPEAASLAPDKLFFVGDDKQSIYRFRGADVSVFKRLGAELGGASPRLRRNYRSEPGLITFFNGLFARVFAGAEADYEARFEEALARDASPGLRPSVGLLWKPRAVAGEQGEFRSADEALADGIARFIRTRVEGGSLLLPDGSGGSRPASYDDFAILLRSTSKQYLLERFLRLHGIGYSADAVRGLFVESPANDLYAAFRLALLPGDRLAYATVLRSPLVALSDDGFVALLAPRTEAGGPLLPFAPGEEAWLGTDDARRFARGRAIFERLAEDIDRRPIASLVSYLWFDCGLRLSILRRPDAHPYLEHYDFLFALAVRSDSAGEGLSTFLARLAPLMGLPEKLDDLAVQRESGQGVRIMSVHRSKGLEFPVVILPWIENTGRSDGSGEAFYLSATAGLTLNLRPWDEPGAPRSNVFYDEARELDLAKEKAETKRLFYVACTRAESHLVFAAVEPARADKTGSSFLGLLASGGEMDPENRLVGLPPEATMTWLPDLSEEDYRRLAGGARRRDASTLASAYAAAKPLERRLERRSLSATALNAAFLRRIATSPATAASDQGTNILSGTAFGTLCHAAIEGLILGREPSLPRALLDLFPEGLRDEAGAEALRLAAGFVDSELGRRCLGFPVVATEKGFVLDLADPRGQGWRITGRMDLFVESEDEILIVDFKSNTASVPGEYEVQLALYRAAAAAFAPGKSVRCFLFWLRAARAEELTVAPSPELLAELAHEASLMTELDSGEGHDGEEA